MFEVTADFFIDTLTHFPAFLTPGDNASLRTILSGPLAQSHIRNLRTDVFEIISTTFAKLLVAFGEALVQELAQNCDQPSHAQILRQLVDLLACDANAGDGEVASSQCLHFWTTFTEFLVDEQCIDPPRWWLCARSYIPAIIRVCLDKIRWPQADALLSWDRGDRDAFKDLRGDVLDLIQSAYGVIGLDLFISFVHLAFESLTRQAWFQLEASLFCLNALSDDVSDEDYMDEALSKFFGSSFFADVMSSSTVPVMCRHTTVKLVTNYTSFFKRHPDYQPAVLNFLFESVKTPPMANAAGKALQVFCCACRKALASQIGVFLHHYEILLTWRVDASTKEKVIGAIAAIVQAIPSEKEKFDNLDNLLSFVESDVQASVRLREESREEESLAHGLCALRCLVNIGKAFQAPDDVTIDLVARTHPSDLWIEGTRISSTQVKIISMMDTVTRSASNDSHVMETACQILRSGYKEIAPGPFVFPPMETAIFAASCDLKTARLDYVLETAGALLSRHRNTPTADVNDAAFWFLVQVFKLVNAMDGKTVDQDYFFFMALPLCME